MTNEAFAHVKIEALLAAQGWDLLNTSVVRFVVLKLGAQVNSPAIEQGRL